MQEVPTTVRIHLHQAKGKGKMPKHITMR